MQRERVEFFHGRTCMVVALLMLLISSAVPIQSTTNAARVSGATFEITWSVNCQPPPAEAVTTLNYAASLWGTWISSTVPIAVVACWTPNPSGGDALGTGMPSKYVYNFPGAPLANTAYPIALANALSNSDLEPTWGDMTLQFKSDTTWSFVLTPTHLTAPVDGEDFVSVALHELAHGLGFIGNMYEEWNVGFCGHPLYPCPTPYDWFAVDSAGIALLSYLPNDPYALAARLKGDANFGGPNTVAANAGITAKLYTPGAWTVGSSLSHLDPTAFGSSVNHLMTPFYSDVTRHPGPVTLAIFQDMGWLRADGVPNVVIAPPPALHAGRATAFTGDLIWPAYAGQPITYTWTATEQMTVTHAGLADADNVTFTWAAPGVKQIALTATDGVSSASAIRTVFVRTTVFLPLVLQQWN